MKAYVTIEIIDICPNCPTHYYAIIEGKGGTAMCKKMDREAPTKIPKWCPLDDVQK